MEIVPRYRFDALVADALDDLPDELLHGARQRRGAGRRPQPRRPDLLGLYDGVPHTERTGHEGPDIVSIYRVPLCEMCDDLDELAEEVYVTVIHEIAHARPASTTRCAGLSTSSDTSEWARP
jgi:predicted Zn-dependent protease with MMP-like domain